MGGFGIDRYISPRILNRQQLLKYRSNFLHVSELCKNNESLETYFKGLIATLLDLECTSNGIGSLLAEAVFLVFALTGEKNTRKRASASRE